MFLAQRKKSPCWELGWELLTILRARDDAGSFHVESWDSPPNLYPTIGDGLDGPWKAMLTLYGKHITEWSFPSTKQDSSEKAGVTISQAIKVNRGVHVQMWAEAGLLPSAWYPPNKDLLLLPVIRVQEVTSPIQPSSW